MLRDYSYSWASGNPGIPNAWNSPSQRMTVVGQLTRVFLGVPPSHPAIQSFTSTLTPVTVSQTMYPVYMNMHATQLMHRVGGQAWENWNSAMQNMLLPAQKTAAAGHMEGSWDADNPPCNWNDTDHGGRLYVTAMYSLCLQRYFAGLRLGE